MARRHVPSSNSWAVLSLELFLKSLTGNNNSLFFFPIYIYIFFWCYKLFVGICSYLIEQLAKDGFVIISVPYNVTFDHANAAKQVYERFNSCLDSILISGLPHANLTPQQLVNLPLFSVGHRFVNFIIFFLYYITLLLLTAYSNNKLII